MHDNVHELHNLQGARTINHTQPYTRLSDTSCAVVYYFMNNVDSINYFFCISCMHYKVESVKPSVYSNLMNDGCTCI